MSEIHPKGLLTSHWPGIPTTPSIPPEAVGSFRLTRALPPTYRQGIECESRGLNRECTQVCGTGQTGACVALHCTHATAHHLDVRGSERFASDEEPPDGEHHGLQLMAAHGMAAHGMAWHGAASGNEHASSQRCRHCCGRSTGTSRGGGGGWRSLRQPRRARGGKGGGGCLPVRQNLPQVLGVEDVRRPRHVVVMERCTPFAVAAAKHRKPVQRASRSVPCNK